MHSNLAQVSLMTVDSNDNVSRDQKRLYTRVNNAATMCVYFPWLSSICAHPVCMMYRHQDWVNATSADRACDTPRHTAVSHQSTDALWLLTSYYWYTTLLHTRV